MVPGSASSQTTSPQRLNDLPFLPVLDSPAAGRQHSFLHPGQLTQQLAFGLPKKSPSMADNDIGNGSP